MPIRQNEISATLHIAFDRIRKYLQMFIKYGVVGSREKYTKECHCRNAHCTFVTEFFFA